MKHLLTSNPAGSAEAISEFPLAAAGEYFVRVFEANTPLESQLYELVLAVCPIAMSPQSADSLVAQNRYLSFDPGNAGFESALQVTLVEFDQFPALVGASWWVGPPSPACEGGGEIVPPCSNFPGLPSSTFLTSSLQCDQLCMDWGAFGEPIHVGDVNIVPGATYEVRSIACTCGEGDSGGFSQPLAVATSRWGDTLGSCAECGCNAPQGGVSISDCLGVLARFSNTPCAPRKSRVDLVPATPDRQINVNDALGCIVAFQGLAYDLSFPVGCP